MLTCEIRLRDICLPCYADRFYPISVAVDGTTTIAETLDRLWDEWLPDCGPESFELGEEHETAFKAAVEVMREQNRDVLHKPLDSSLEAPEAYEDGESVYAYFSVSFSEVD